MVANGDGHQASEDARSAETAVAVAEAAARELEPKQPASKAPTAAPGKELDLVKGTYNPDAFAAHPMAKTINKTVDAMDLTGAKPAEENQLGAHAMACVEFYGKQIPPWVAFAWVSTLTLGTIASHNVRHYLDAKKGAAAAPKPAAVDFSQV